MKIFFILKIFLDMDMITSRVYINLTPGYRGVHSSQSYTESKAILIQKAIRHFLSRKNDKKTTIFRRDSVRQSLLSH